MFRGQKCATKFLHAENIIPINTQRCSVSVYGDHLVDVSTVRWCVVHFNCGYSDVSSHVLGKPKMLTMREINSSLISLSKRINGLPPDKCVRSWILGLMRWKRCLQPWYIYIYIYNNLLNNSTYGKGKVPASNSKIKICNESLSRGKKYIYIGGKKERPTLSYQ